MPSALPGYIRAPVGFEGELKMNHLVLGVIADSSCSAVSLKLFCKVVSTTTGVPPASRTMSG